MKAARPLCTRHLVRSLLVLVALPFTSTMTVSAGDAIEDLEHTIFLYEANHNIQKPEDLPPWLKEIKQLIDTARENRALQHQLAGKVGVGFTGDTAGDQNVFKVNTDSVISVGNYPRAVRLGAGAQVRLSNGKLEEDVTRLVVNYDFYFQPWLETYAFVERFTDNFLSIDQRYEVGGGMKFEWNVFDFALPLLRTPPPAQNNCWPLCGYVASGRGKLRTLDALDSLERNKDSLPVSPLLPRPDEQIKAFQTVAKGPVFESMKKRYSKLQLGLALSFLSEFEQASIKTEVMRSSGNMQETFSLPPEQRWRWVARPSFLCRPNDSIEIDARFYYKYPLGSPTRAFDRYDVRSDLFVNVTFKFGEKVTLAEKAAVVFGYEWHSDNAQPRLDPQTLIALQAAMATPAITEAERAHQVYKMTMQLSF